MKLYEVWFQDGHIMFTVSARNNQEARKEANRMISIKERKTQKDTKGKVAE